MSTAESSNVRRQRLNFRALVTLGVLIAAAVGGLYVLGRVGASRSRATALAEARRQLARKPPQPSLALGYVNQYLEQNPDDLDALELKAGILANAAHDELQARDAIKVNDRILARDPDGPKAQETRRRLVTLWLRVGQPDAAEAVARELVRRGPGDAEAHRLLARALLHGLAARGETRALDEARREFEAAERISPGDVDGAELLAAIYREKLDDPKRAGAVLDALVEHNRGGAPETLARAYLARSQHWLALRQRDRAAEDLGRALKADPGSREVRLAAAEGDLRRGDAASARRNLEAIGPAGRDDRRVRLLQGLIDLGEQRPEEAIQSWRSGLLLSGGTDVELTWRLAHLLLESDRPAEAEPLIDQYRRLTGGDDPTPPCRYLQAYALLRTHRPAEAIAELSAIRYKVDKALEPHLHYVLGQCYEAERNDERALAAYAKAAELAGDWNAPWLAIARLQAADHPDRAIGTLEQALVALPGDPKLLAALAGIRWRQQAQLPPGKRSWGELEQALDRARAAAPGSVELALTEADYLMAAGRADDALELLRAASKLSPKSVPVWTARVNALARTGRVAEAIEAIEQATAAAGPQAAFYALRASLELGRGHAGAARTALADGLGRVPDDQKPTLWKALGELRAGQADMAGARQAYERWAELRPDDPEPRVVLLDLALNAGDEAEIGKRVAALKAIGGPSAPYWRMARVQELMRIAPGAAPDDPARLKEAEGLIAEIIKNNPRLALGYILEGRLRERRSQTDKAIAAYERALELKGGQAALGPLVALLVRERRDAELERVRRTAAATPREVDRLAAIQALKAGDKGQAEQLAARFVQGDPQALDARVWQTQLLRAVGKPKEAEEALRRLVRQRPEEAEPWVQLIMFLIAQRRVGDARDAIEQMRAKVRADHPEVLLARCYAAAGDLRRASESYRAALARAPGDLGLRRAAIDYCEEVGLQSSAEALLRDTLKLDPALGWANRRLALSLAGHTGDRASWEEALRLIGAEARPDDGPDDALTRARVYAQGPEAAQRRKAVRILEAFVGERPDSAPARELLARLLYQAGRRDEALRQAERAASAEGATTEAVLLYAGYLLVAGDLDKAEAQLKRLAQSDPDGLPVAELRARILSARGRGPEAAGVLEKALADRAGAPDELTVARKMVAVLTEIHQPEAAERVARHAAKLGPAGACLLAEYLAERGRFDEAASALDGAASGAPREAAAAALAIAARPGSGAGWLDRVDRLVAAAAKAQGESVDLLTIRAPLRYLQGRYEEAIAAYKAILERKPSSYMFLNNMAWILSEDLGRPEEGLKWIDEAIARVGRHPSLLDTRGVILSRLGRLDEAVGDLEAAAEWDPSGPIYFHLAVACRKRGRAEAFAKYRDLARKAGLRPEQLEPSERGAWDEIMKG